MITSKKDINLLPKSDFEKSGLGKLFHWFLRVGRFIVIGTELVVIIAFVARFKLDRDLTNINESIKEKQTAINSYGDLENKIRFLQERVNTIRKLQPTQLQVTQILTDLEKITPTDIYLDSLVINQNKFKTDAVALSDASMSFFLQNLQKDQRFENVNLSSLTTGGSVESDIKFTVSANIVK